MKVAILDMNNGVKNLGMGGIQAIVERFPSLDYEVFDVRQANEIPGLEFEVYIFSGGPGDPRTHYPAWSDRFAQLLNGLWIHNKKSENRKFVFFICYSFQMACAQFELGVLNERRSRSLGIYPVHLTENGESDVLFSQLVNPFYVADSRDYQLVEPNPDRFEKTGAQILALEKLRPHVPLERAVMAVRFSPYWMGTQFHPEADPEGMLKTLQKDAVREDLISRKGMEKYQSMLVIALDRKKLAATYDHVLPGFLESCITMTAESVESEV